MRSKRLAATLAATMAAGFMVAPAADAKKRTVKSAKADPLSELVCNTLGLGKTVGKLEASLAPLLRVRLGICQKLD